MGDHVGNSKTVSTIIEKTNICVSIHDRLTDEQRDFLKGAKNSQKEKGLEVETTLADLNPSNPTDIIKLKTVISSICMIRDKTTRNDVATGFLANSLNIGTVFCSAGHNFKHILGSGGIEELDRYIIHFGNIEGNIITDADVVSPPMKGKPMMLRDFLCMFQFYGSISHRGKRKTFRKTSSSWDVTDEINTDAEEDYCALKLIHSDIVGELKKLGLDRLDLGTGNYLDYNRKGLATIVGHPGGNATETTSDGAKIKPLRYSFGKEKAARPRSDNKLHFEYDSLGGNSGSPIIGRGYKDSSNSVDQAYKVKGIHIQGNKTGNLAYNCAQKITRLGEWIQYGI